MGCVFAACLAGICRLPFPGIAFGHNRLSCRAAVAEPRADAAEARLTLRNPALFLWHGMRVAAQKRSELPFARNGQGGSAVHIYEILPCRCFRHFTLLLRGHVRLQDGRSYLRWQFRGSY